MKKILITIILFLTIVTSSTAQTVDNTGYSYLGICHSRWPCQTSLQAYKEKSKLRLSFLYDNTFGDDCPCIREFYKDPRPKFTRIHLINGPGLRNNRLQQQEVFYGYSFSQAQEAILKEDPALKQKFEAVAKRASYDFSQSVGENMLYVSTCLECNFSKKTRQKLISWAKPYFPNAIFVDNPLVDSCLPGLVCEKHGANAKLKPPLCIADLDGQDFEEVNMPQYIEDYQGCLANYIWGYRFNLNDGNSKKFIAPRQRVLVPDQAYFDLLP